jgi:hypothetical protein
MWANTDYKIPWMYRQRDRQTGRQTDRQTDRETGTRIMLIKISLTPWTRCCTVHSELLTFHSCTQWKVHYLEFRTHFFLYTLSWDCTKWWEVVFLVGLWDYIVISANYQWTRVFQYMVPTFCLLPEHSTSAVTFGKLLSFCQVTSGAG